MHEDIRIIIEKILQDTFKPSKIIVTDESHLHVGHEGARGNPEAGHFKVVIKSDAFADLTKIKQHKAIYAALSSLMKEKIHALTIESSS